MAPWWHQMIGGMPNNAPYRKQLVEYFENGEILIRNFCNLAAEKRIWSVVKGSCSGHFSIYYFPFRILIVESKTKN